MWVPKGTPKEIIDRLYAEVVKILQQPDIKALWDSQGATAGGQSPAEFAKFQRAEIERWGKVVRDAKIKIDN
jgi:tripartite-type tricarboxylate transporter receptor subunit TctC